MMKSFLTLCILALLPLIHAVNYRRTVIAIEKPTDPTQYMFVRGGRMGGNVIPIRHRVKPEDKTSFFAQTSSRDQYLGWNRYDPWQGVYRMSGVTKYAEGTPMMWTTNNTGYSQTVKKNGAGYWPLNTGGAHYWVVDFEMDCDKVFYGGWFAFKGYLVDLYGGDPGWESSSLYQTSCEVDGERVNIPKAKTYNHYGRCGNFNIVKWGTNFCMSRKMGDVIADASFVEQEVIVN